MAVKTGRSKIWLVVLIVAVTFNLAGSLGFLFFLENSVARGLPAMAEEKISAAKTTFIYDNRGREIARVHGEINRIPVTLEKMTLHLKNAFLASEDARFYEHRGVDLIGLARAVVANLKAGRVVQGGSTITQQLVKTSFLTPERTFSRKWQELWLSLAMERRYTKDEILQMYINEIYYGHGAYGAEAAAQLYLGKSADKLTLAESALIAGLPRRPQKYSPYIDLEAARQRQRVILGLMVEHGFITEEQKEAAEKEKLALRPLPKSKNYSYPYFVDYVLDELSEQHGFTPTQVYRGGLRVYTTMDRRIQGAAEEAMKQDYLFPRSGPKEKVQGAMAILDYHDGTIKALAGGRDYRAVRGFNRATDLKRQPGSSFKPVAVYGPALEKGISPNTVLTDAPVSYDGYSPKNADGKYRGPISMGTAVKYSVNVYAVKLLKKIGVMKGYNFAQKLGFKLSPRDVGLPLALGGLTEGVSPLQMAAAYGAFGHQGVYCEPRAVVKVAGSDGKVLYETPLNRKKAMEPRTGYVMTKMLQEVVKGGTGTRARLGSRPVAGKTGTTQLPDTAEFRGLRGTKDAWFVGYTPELVAAVWMGYDHTDRRHYMRGVYGGTYPARLWQYVMSRALAGEPVKPFPRPDGISGEWLRLREEKPAEEEPEEDAGEGGETPVGAEEPVETGDGDSGEGGLEPGDGTAGDGDDGGVDPGDGTGEPGDGAGGGDGGAGDGGAGGGGDDGGTGDDGGGAGGTPGDDDGSDGGDSSGGGNEDNSNAGGNSSSHYGNNKH